MTDAWDGFLTERQRKIALDAMKNLIKGLGIDPKHAAVFHAMTDEQKIFIAILFTTQADAVTSSIQLAREMKKRGSS